MKFDRTQYERSNNPRIRGSLGRCDSCKLAFVFLLPLRSEEARCLNCGRHLDQTTRRLSWDFHLIPADVCRSIRSRAYFGGTAGPEINALEDAIDKLIAKRNELYHETRVEAIAFEKKWHAEHPYDREAGVGQAYYRTYDQPEYKEIEARRKPEMGALSDQISSLRSDIAKVLEAWRKEGR